MGLGDGDDTHQTTEPEAPTATLDEAQPRAGDESPAAHRRGPGLLLPVVVFVALLTAAALVGRYVVPAGGPDPGAVPPAPAAQPGATGTAAGPSPTLTLPPLPTPPIRPADALADWASRVGGVVGVPAVAVQAYGYTQLLMQGADPQCRLGWTTLAGVGEVESRHGQAAGAVLEPSGRSAPVIVGPLLDGQGGRALVRDTDAGAFDGDPTYDRAMGPMRLMPSVWRAHALDADADGILDPYDIDDASLAVARLLCSGAEDLGQLAGWNAAIGRLRPGAAHARSVFDAANSYGERTRNIG